MFFGASFMGDLSDMFGRKRMLLVCMAGLWVSFVCMGVGVKLSCLWLLLVGRGLSGLMAASMPVALAAIADLSTRGDKAVHMSFVTLVQSGGFVVGPLMGGVLVDPSLVSFFDSSTPFFAASGLAVIAFLWLAWGFQETFKLQPEKKIRLSRLFEVFVEAFHHRAIRILAVAFFLMQAAISFYMQLILIFYRQQFQYSGLKMGLFNGYIGVWFGLGLIFVTPVMARRYSVEKMAWLCLFVTGAAQLCVSLTQNEWLLWLFAIPLGVAVQVGFTAMLTSFSNAACANAQGWAMGITGSLEALAFVLTALSSNLVPVMGAQSLILVGGILMLIAAVIMVFYHRRVVSKGVSG
jgi:MFS family permease